jgi:hypothetical protein
MKLENKNVGLALISGGIGLAFTTIILMILGISLNPFGPIFFFTVIACICIGIYFYSGHPNPNAEWKKDMELVEKRSKKSQKRGLIILIVGFIIILLCLLGASLINWNFSLGGGLVTIPFYFFLSIGIILMIIGLVCIVYLGKLRKKRLLMKLSDSI